MRKVANDDLDKMNHQEVPGTDTEELADIRDVRIDPKSSKEEKLRSFLEQIKNPYRFRCGSHIVRVSFSETDRTLEDCLEDYFNSLI